MMISHGGSDDVTLFTLCN